MRTWAIDDPQLHRYLGAVAKNHHVPKDDIDDHVQEALITLLRRARRGQPISPLNCRNAIIDAQRMLGPLHRDGRPRRIVALSLQAATTDDGEALLDEIVPGGVEYDLEAAHRGATLRRVWREASQRTRRALLLRLNGTPTGTYDAHLRSQFLARYRAAMQEA